MTMFMMKSAQRPAAGAAGGEPHNPYSEIWSILYGMMMMNFVEYSFKHLPLLLVMLQTWALTKWRPKQKEWLPNLSKSDKEKELLNSITLMRVFQKQTSDRETNVNVEKVDAVLEYICALDNARHVRLDTRYTIGSTEDINLTPDLKGRVKQVSGDGVSVGSPSSDDTTVFEIVLFSSTLKLTEIRSWIDDVHKNYTFEKNNKLGNNIYYFNEIPHEPIVVTDMTGDNPKKVYKWDNMPKSLTFNMNEFKTSKSFSNVFGNHVDELKERLDLFVHHPEWYAERGIPHSLGIMLHGIPGAGKTSTIKAIAKDTHRHIFNLSLRPYTTQKQLLNLFYNESVVVYKYDGSKTSYNIPMNRRVYVIEDIDCMTDVTLDRSLIPSTASTAPEGGSGDAVTLSFLLNLLDGVLETPGRILVITSNYPEKLDKALVRPGRIDVKIEFKNASREFIREMVSRFYSKTITLETIPAELEDKFTPAEVMESLCTYFKESDAAIKHMLQKLEIIQKSRKEPCLKVQIEIVSPAAPAIKLSSEVPKNVLIDSKPIEDKGTSLESLGILNEQKQQKQDIKKGMQNHQEEFYIKGDSYGDLMASNTLTKPPPESLLTSGVIIDEEATKRSLGTIDPMSISRYLIPNPEFVADTSGIGAFDIHGNAPSTWSEPTAESEFINPDSAENKALLYQKSNEFTQFISGGSI